MEKNIKPSYEKARRRTKEEVKVLTDKYIIDNNLSKLGLNKKYFIITYGCQANVRDSETIKAILEDMSFKECNDMEEANLILLNTFKRNKRRYNYSIMWMYGSRRICCK